MTDLLIVRATGTGGDAGDGVSGRTARWVQTTSPNTTRTVNGEEGRVFGEGETWCGIFGVNPSGQDVGRVADWHDVPMSGWPWGFVAPIALDLRPDGRWIQEYLMEPTPCPGAANYDVPPHTSKVTVIPNEWNWVYVQITFSKQCSDGRTQLWIVNSQRPRSLPALVNITGRTLNPKTGPACRFFQGLYRSSNYNGPTITHDFTLDRWGQNWDAALADRPVIVNSWGTPKSSWGETGVVDTSAIPVPNDIRPTASASDLRDRAIAELRLTTISYPDWKRRLDQGRYQNPSATHWWKALDHLNDIT